jgi:hypothetical protein
MQNSQSVTKLLSSLMDSIANYTYEEPHVYTFRGSSLPYCPVREAVTICRKKVNNLPKRKTSLKQQLDMDIGTLIHAHFQKIAGILGSLFGNWVCGVCGREFLLKSGPIFCCDKPSEYKEIRVKHEESGFSGSVDGLIKNSDHSYIVIDFKTKARLPSFSAGIDKNHRAQILAYKHLLTKEPYNFQISSIAIIYVLRSDVSKFRIQEIPDDEFTELEFNNYVRNRKKMSISLEDGDLNTLTKICSSISDAKYCPYGSLCFSENSEALLRQEWENYFNKINY